MGSTHSHTISSGEDKKSPTLTESIGLGMRFVISTISKSFPSVKNISTDSLQDWLHSEDREVVLLDCRDPEEYEVSRMPQSIRVDWKTEDVDKLMNTLTESKFKNENDVKKTIVCYCSVGYRSSDFAKKIQEYLKKQDGETNYEIYNLAGSLFKWANENRELIDNEGQKTVFAHPYNVVWGKLLKRELRKS